MTIERRIGRPPTIGAPIHVDTLLSALTPASRADFWKATLERICRQGERLTVQGEPCLELFILLKGTARLHLRTGGGIALERRVVRNEVIGITDCLAGAGHSFTLFATGPGCFGNIGQARFRKILHADPAGCFEILKMLGEGLQTDYETIIGR